MSGIAQKSVSSDDLANWREELALISEQIRSLQERAQRAQARIRAAEALFQMLADEPAESPRALIADRTQEPTPRQEWLSDEFSNAIAPTEQKGARAQRNYGRITFMQGVNKIVGELPEGRVAHGNLRELVEKSDELGDRIRESDKGFYHAVSRLTAAGEIVKHNGWIYSRAGYESHMSDVAAGLRPDDKAPSNSRPSALVDGIVEFVEIIGPSTSKEIISYLGSEPKYQSALENKTFVYNVLSRLVAKKVLVKQGNKYESPAAQGEKASSSSEEAF